MSLKFRPGKLTRLQNPNTRYRLYEIMAFVVLALLLILGLSVLIY